MGLFSKLFGREKNALSDTSIEGRSTVYAKLVEYVAVSEDVRTELTELIEIAFASPKKFYDGSLDFDLSDRGLSYPDDKNDTPKFVFVDKLISVGQMAEVDWKSDEEEVRFTVAEILKAKEYNVPFDLSDKYSLDTLNTINKISDNELMRLGYCIELLDINSDSYVFAIVPTDTRQTVRELFNKIE